MYNMQQMNPLNSCVRCGYPGCMNRKFSVILPEDVQTTMVCLHSKCYELRVCDSCKHINSMCQCSIVVFSQNIPCRARRAFLEHVGVAITNFRTFEVTLAQMTVPTRTFRVQCTNTVGRTFFSGVAWTTLAEHYQMEPAQTCNFFLDHGTEEVYFMYKHPDYPRSDSSDEDDI